MLSPRKDAFSERARHYGLPLPKGLLILGLPGTGKSLTAKATASVFGVPLLRLDAGRLFGSLVGQSEGNLRAVLQTAEVIAPCCLWIDEIEKGFSGTKSSGSSDGGTSARVFGTFLNWMQEKTAPVCVVATANDVSQLPPELLRKGRFDELFFVDLPTPEERQIIWTLQITRHDRNPHERRTEPTDLEGAIQSFDEGGLDLGPGEAIGGLGERRDVVDIAQVLTTFMPLSKLMAEPITALRQWAKGRARPATTPPAESKLTSPTARVIQFPASGPDSEKKEPGLRRDSWWDCPGYCTASFLSQRTTVLTWHFRRLARLKIVNLLPSKRASPVRVPIHK